MASIRMNTSNLEQVLREASRGARLSIAQDILDDAKASAPVDTGALRDSGYLEEDGVSGDIRIGFTVNYASYVEFGTSKMRAQPYLRPAAAKRR